MKDLIFIGAYCPTEEHEKLLEKCIDSVLKTNRHIVLVSHSHIPIHLQKKCNYYIYDHLNDTSTDPELLGFFSFYFQNKKIQSIFFNSVFYGFAIYRMMCLASQVAINFGYENLHYIEYDCELLDIELLNQNSEHLTVYDSVLYTADSQATALLFGPFSSFKVNKLPEKFKNYDRNFIDTEMRNIWPRCLESLTKKIFVESGNVLFLSEPSQDVLKSGTSRKVRGINFTLFFNQEDSSINLFYKNVFENDQNLIVLVNKITAIEVTVKTNHWHMRSLGPIEHVNHVKIYNQEKIILDTHFDNNLRNVYKLKSYISDIN